MKNKLKENFLDIIFCGGGCIIYSAAIRVFAEENGMAEGGATGAALLLNHLFPILPKGVILLLLNLPLFILAWKFIGGKFILKSFFVTLFLSFTLDAVSFLPTYTGDRLLSAIFCGAISGSALSLIFIRNLTSGGTDILARLIRLKKPHFSMGRLILTADFIIVLSAGIVYRNAESAMYSLILIFVSSFVIDKILFGLTDSRTLIIISDFPQKIATEIMSEFSRGVSILPAEGGYTGKSKRILLCALKRTETPRIINAISTLDKNAFTIVLPSNEIVGQGFK